MGITKRDIIKEFSKKNVTLRPDALSFIIKYLEDEPNSDIKLIISKAHSYLSTNNISFLDEYNLKIILNYNNSKQVTDDYVNSDDKNDDEYYKKFCNNLIFISNFNSNKYVLDNRMNLIADEEKRSFFGNNSYSHYKYKFNIFRSFVNKSNNFYFDYNDRNVNNNLNTIYQLREIGSLMPSNPKEEVYTFGILNYSINSYYLENEMNNYKLKFGANINDINFFLNIGNIIIVKCIVYEYYIEAREIISPSEINLDIDPYQNIYKADCRYRDIYNIYDGYDKLDNKIELKDDHNIVIISNCDLSKNVFTTYLENILNKVIGHDKQTIIFLVGPFWNTSLLGSDINYQHFEDKLEELSKILKTYISIKPNLKFAVIPGNPDFGCTGLPKKEFSENLFYNIKKASPESIYLCENPCKFVYNSKNFVILKAELTKTLSKNNIGNVSNNIDTNEVLINTVISQNSLVGGSSKIVVHKDFQNELFVPLFPCNLIICDDNSSYILYEHKYNNLITVIGNFTKDGTSVMIDPTTNKITEISQSDNFIEE